VFLNTEDGKSDSSPKKSSMEVVDHSDEGPYVGSGIEVLFDVDGNQYWYGGKIISKEK